jgi:hypothetical protein
MLESIDDPPSCPSVFAVEAKLLLFVGNAAGSYCMAISSFWASNRQHSAE